MKEQKKIKKDKINNNILIRNILITIIILLIGTIVGLLIYKSNRKEISCNDSKEETISIYDIEPIVKDYSSISNSKVYLYNTNEVRLQNNLLLKDYLNKYKDLDSLFSSLEDYLIIEKTLKDGGTIIYKTKEKNELFAQNLTIIRCNTSDGNKDIYFGEYIDTLTAFENGACGKNFFSDVAFTRVYTIKSIKLVENNKYELVIYDDNADKSITFFKTMSDESREILKENEKFTFHFTNKYGELLKEDIEDIFEKATLVGVVPYGK